MEAAAISIATSAVNSVVKTAITTIRNEIGLLLGVQEELFFIKDELEMMQGFLQAASTVKVKDIVLTIWVKQVQELAFDVEDCLQEASVHQMKNSCLPIMCSGKKRDHIAKKIRMLKTRIEDVSQRNVRYNLINKHNGGHTYDESASTSSIANVEDLLVGLEEPKAKLVELILKEHGEVRDEPQKGHVIFVVGMGGLGKTTLVREVYVCKELINEFQHFAWVTVLHPFNKEELIDCLAKEIPSKSEKNDKEGRTVDENKSEVLYQKTIKENKEENVKKYLKEKKYLIVLDDLSNLSEWKKIKDVLPVVNGSRIIVTTRDKSLAESITEQSENIYEIKKLSEEDAFDLFCKAVYKTSKYHLVNDEGPSSTERKEEDSKVQEQSITITFTKDMDIEARLIIKSCDLLPLAIVTVGSYLATKPKIGAEWKKMQDQLSTELTTNPTLGVVKTVLTSSYDGMPYHLKPSLLYLSVFHNHKEIRRSRIIRRWIADGYVVGGRKKTAEDVGNDYFIDLMGRSLIQPSQMSTIVNGNIKRCNVHDIMYELILAKAMDENIVSLLEDENLITKTDKVRHLVITGESCKGEKVLERVKVSNMRSLSIFGEVGHYLSYRKMKLVRVLDLEGTLNLHDRDLRCVGKLRHLKYLGLRGTKITKLPDSLGKLSELETLDIRNTNVFRLPTGLTKLHKLSYLRAGFDLPKNKFWRRVDPIFEKFMFYLCCPQELSNDIGCPNKCCWCPSWCAFPVCFFLICFVWIRENIKNNDTYGARAPRGIGELKSLNILGMIDIGQSKGLAKELQNPTNLRKLAVTGFTKKNGKTLANVIDGLKHLRSLVLSASDDSGLKCCLESVSSPPRFLQSLKLYSSLGELPIWISSLENLEKIHFRNTLLREDIKAIEKLPNLKILYMLYDTFTGLKELCFGKGTFPMLQVLILEEEVKSVSIENTAFKRLQQLKISHCMSVREGGVSGLEFLVQLKEMEVVRYSGDYERDRELVSNIKEQLKKLPKEPVLSVIKRD